MRRDLLSAIVSSFAVVLFAVVALWLYSRHSEISTVIADQKRGEAAALVDAFLASPEVREVFTGPTSVRQRQVIESAFGAIRPSEALGIRVRDRNLAVLWSSPGDLLGKHFAAGQGLQEALEGQVGFAITKVKVQSLSQRSDEELITTYVPISDKMGRIAGVVEVYQPALALRGEVRTQFRRMVLPLGLLMFAGCGVLVFLLRMLMALATPKVDAKPVLTYSTEPNSFLSPRSR